MKVRVTTVLSLTVLFYLLEVTFMGVLSVGDVPFSYKEAISLKNSTLIVSTDRSRGSGSFVKTPTGRFIVITNAHVCIKDTYGPAIRVKPPKSYKRYYISNNRTLGTAYPLKLDVNNDLCSLRIDFTPKDYIELSEIKPFQGQSLYVSTYHPRTNNYQLKSSRYIHRDKVNDLWSKLHQDSILIATRIIPGMSGSPILDNHGKLVMVVWGSARIPGNPFRGYAVGYDAVAKFIRSHK